MTSLGDHPVWHPVADLFKEDLMVTCSDAGDGLALDHPTDHLGEGGAGASHHQRYEHNRQSYHHRYLGAHLLLLSSGEGACISAFPPLGVTAARMLIAASAARRIPQAHCYFCLCSQKCREKPSDKGFEQRSKRRSGRCTEAKTGRRHLCLLVGLEFDTTGSCGVKVFAMVNVTYPVKG